MVVEIPKTNLEKTLSLRLQYVLNEWKLMAEELRANAVGERTKFYYTWMAGEMEMKLEQLIRDLNKIEYLEVT